MKKKKNSYTKRRTHLINIGIPISSIVPLRLKLSHDFFITVFWLSVRPDCGPVELEQPIPPAENIEC